MAADVIGSAVPARGQAPRDWVSNVLVRTCDADELRGVALQRLSGAAPRAFQREAAESASRVTLVKASCGSGKTAAAYLWAARNAAGRKVFFCYPTTGTATEGYRGYVLQSEMRKESALLHSRSEIDFEDIMSSPGDDPKHYAALDRAVEIESLTALDPPLVICTADRVLGLVQNSRRGLCSLPAFLNAVFVFDEIHQYDDRLFGALLRFLDTFRGAPVLLMTASLPAARLDALRMILDSTGNPLGTIEGPADMEKIERYRFGAPANAPPWEAMRGALDSGDKVLWVANTVKRATEFAQQAVESGLAPMFLYHSRYRYCDRLRHHNEVISAFGQCEKPVLAVTTQVCEVSLDISADLLVTDLAPVPSLIQRLGRLNRRVSPESPGTPRTAVFLEPEDVIPYGRDGFDPDRVRVWVKSLSEGPVSQADLARAFESDCQGELPGPCNSQWLDGGPFSSAAPLRESGVTVSVIRAEDEHLCRGKQGRPSAREIARYSIPMPLGRAAREIGSWNRLGYAFVAAAGRIDYSVEWGARWAE